MKIDVLSFQKKKKLYPHFHSLGIKQKSREYIVITNEWASNIVLLLNVKVGKNIG